MIQEKNQKSEYRAKLPAGINQKWFGQLHHPEPSRRTNQKFKCSKYHLIGHCERLSGRSLGTKGSMAISIFGSPTI